MKIRKIFLVLLLPLLLFIHVGEVKAEMDPKVKALGTMAVYGTVGGALLGAASLAFGAGGRAIAVGASLGLYAGLIFGTYVIVSHQMKKRGYFDENNSAPATSPPPAGQPYRPQNDSYQPYQPGYDGAGGTEYNGEYYQRSLNFSDLNAAMHGQTNSRNTFEYWASKKSGPEKIFQVQLLQIQF